MTTLPLIFTVITSAVPKRLTKVLRLKSDGTLEKSSAAMMVSGTARRQTAADLNELARKLDALTPAQAVTWGVCDRDQAPIVREEDEGDTPGAISRTQRHFSFPKGPGVMMLDHDGGHGESLSLEVLHARLLLACPALQGAPMLWRPSASAGVFSPTGKRLSEVTRYRGYIPVRDASLIPATGEKLAALLWAAGMGWVEVGNAGQALMRCLLDTSVWGPERLDFAAPPILLDGLTRPHVKHRISGDPAGRFDLTLIEAPAAVFKAAKEAQKAARNEAKPRCSIARARWAAEHASSLAAERGISESKAEALLSRASADHVLMGDFILTRQGGRRVSVSQVLDEAERWHNQRFADPLGGYPDDDRIAVLNLLGGGRPTLFTHGHGGMRFELIRQAERVRVGRGMRVAATDATLAILQARNELYEFGEGAIAYVAGARARPVTAEWLTDHLGRVCDFYSVRVSEDPCGNRTVSETPEDAPSGIAKAILAKHGQRGFRPLHAVVRRAAPA